MQSQRRDGAPMADASPSTEIDTRTRKSYTAPTLVVRGSVADLTKKGHLGTDGHLSVSDRAAKTGFAPVNAQDILSRLAALKVETWSYIGDADGVRHLGPMAQDFAAAFAVGDDDKRINSADADGVVIAAVQALHQLVQERDRTVRTLQMQLEAVTGRLEAIEAAQPTRVEVAPGR